MIKKEYFLKINQSVPMHKQSQRYCTIGLLLIVLCSASIVAMKKNHELPKLIIPAEFTSAIIKKPKAKKHAPKNYSPNEMNHAKGIPRLPYSWANPNIKPSPPPPPDW